MMDQYAILHNRKTAGTLLKDIIEQQRQRTPQLNILCFSHSMTFPRVIKEYPKAKVIFFMRDPITRFVSGFYSRLRQGKPRHNFPWKPEEAEAFAIFQTPNQLAEAISQPKNKSAIAAMRSIGHIRHTYVDFLGSLKLLEKHKDKIAFIGEQTQFETDFNHLRTLLNIDKDILVPTDDTRCHRNPENLDKSLSEVAYANLKKWYQADYEIYQWCLEKRTDLFGR